MFTVADLFQLSILESADILTGESGFDRPIRNVGLLDYEYISGEIYEGFLPDDLVLSSLLSIRERPDLVVDAVRALVDMGVSCAGIRKIYLEQLPEDLIRYAVERNFSLFLFEEEISFSDIIIKVFDNLKYEDQGRREEELAEKLAERGGSPEEARTLALELRPDLYETGAVICLQGSHRFLREDIDRIQGFFPKEEEEVRWLVSRFRLGAAVFLTFSGRHGKGCGDVIRRLAEQCALGLPGASVGVGGLSKDLGGLGMGLLEAEYACRFSGVTGKGPVFFEEMGPYRLMMPLLDSPWASRYCEAVLGPLLHGLQCDQKRNEILLETLAAYVACSGSIKKTAESLEQHENTVRYRMRQICHILGLKMNEETDWLQMCVSVHLYKMLTFQ